MKTNKDNFLNEEERIINEEIERLAKKYPEFGLKPLGYILLKERPKKTPPAYPQRVVDDSPEEG